MADLTVTLTEDVTVNGHQYGGTKSFIVSGIVDVYKRILTVPASVDTTLVSFKSTVGIADGAMDIQNVKYIRITNLDSSNAVNLSLQIDTAENDTTAADSATVSLEAGKSFILGTPHDSVAVDDDDAGIVTTLHDLESILVDSSSHAVRMEILVASV
jgi:hypothetical protein